MKTLIKNYNRKVQKKLSWILEELINYSHEMSDKYNINEFADLYFTFFSKEYRPDTEIPNAIMFVTIDCGVDENSDIIKSLDAHIYLSKEDLLDIVISCEMNFCNALKCLKLIMLHEIGHVIDNRKYIGLTVDEFKKSAKRSKEDGKVSKLRVNASLDNLIKWSLERNNLVESERLANEAVGITDDDIINFIKTLNG